MDPNFRGYHQFHRRERSSASGLWLRRIQRLEHWDSVRRSGLAATTVAINFTAYGSESDPGPMPVPADAPIEGYPNPGSGDRHALVLDNSTCWLYELYGSYPQTDGSWNAASAAAWDLLADEQRRTWTSRGYRRPFHICGPGALR